MLIKEKIPPYLAYMKLQGKSENTIRCAKSILNQAALFWQENGIAEISQLNKDAVMLYRQEIAWRLTGKGTPLNVRTQRLNIDAVGYFCRYLVDEGLLMADPSAKIPRPKRPKRLPKAIMSLDEVNTIVALPDKKNSTGFRNSTMMISLYSSSMRREEIAHLTLEDIDLKNRELRVCDAKGNKDRVVVIGQEACHALQSYLLEVRPKWINSKNDKHVFLNRFGKGMTPNAVGAIVKKYVQQSGIDKPITTHTFRGSSCTHMLRNGADLRALQLALGHASIESTQVYAEVAMREVHEMHRKFHPREKAFLQVEETENGNN